MKKGKYLRLSNSHRKWISRCIPALLQTGILYEFCDLLYVFLLKAASDEYLLLRDLAALVGSLCEVEGQGIEPLLDAPADRANP